ncbi:hypothetical protein TomTYG75_09240 [Sphingobium sp. TomTYG75]
MATNKQGVPADHDGDDELEIEVEGRRSGTKFALGVLTARPEEWQVALDALSLERPPPGLGPLAPVRDAFVRTVDVVVPLPNQHM